MIGPLVALLFSATPAQALEAHYQAYAAGLNVIEMDARFDIGADRYKIELDYRTVGSFGLLAGAQQKTVVQGRMERGKAIPDTFLSNGMWRGSPRITAIDYPAGLPEVRQLVPPNATEREPVPTDRQANTMDTLSAMATLIAQVNATGRCDGNLTTFDGRRLASLESRTSGMQPLEPTGRSSYAGPTLRCDLVGRQLAGFMLDEDRERLLRPQTGTAWFASVMPGAPMIPVRVAFRTRWFGEATMYLAPKN